MQQIINFILKYKNFLLYVFLLTIALVFTVRARSYHHSKFFNSANWLTGNVYESTHSISSFFSLGTENEKLVEENKWLRQQLYNLEKAPPEPLDSTEITYSVTAAKIIKNSYSLPRNYITLDKGRVDGLEIDMGVITSKGILGIVEHTSKNFSMVQSILNVRSRINAKILNTNHYGSLVWDTKDYRTVQLKDIERLVPLKVGDTIVTGASSSIFPENIPIGVIAHFEVNPNHSSYQIDVKLFNDMTTVKNVYIIKNNQREEIIELESKVGND